MRSDSWYESVNDAIIEDLEGFYENHYDSEIKKTGKGIFLNPCPMCGHNDCCHVTDLALHCFSCEWSGKHTKVYSEYARTALNKSVFEINKELSEWAKIPMPKDSPADMEEKNRQQRVQEVRRAARAYYHAMLLECTNKYDYNNADYTPMAYLLNVRRRKLETLQTFQVGFCDSYFEIQNKLLADGFTQNECKEAKIWVPDGTYVYFYEHPLSGDIVRLNIKNPFMVKDQNGTVWPGYSTGNKVFYYAPGFTFNKDFIIVEGENDAQAVYEAGFKNVIGIGGNISDDQFLFLERAKKKIFAWFDADEVGEKYTTTLNEMLPEKQIYKVSVPSGFKDPDECLVNCENPSARVKECLKTAEELVTDDFKIKMKSINEWSAENRYTRMEFKITGRNNRRQIIGDATLYTGGKIKERQQMTELIKCKSLFKPMNFLLQDAIETHFNSNFDGKTTDELIDLVPYATNTEAIISLLATRYVSLSPEDGDNMMVHIKSKLKKFPGVSDFVDQILKEVNDIQNQGQKDISAIPRMKVSQYFNIRNNDAYFYYTKIKSDGDTIRKLPYLLRNDKKSIRLDLLKRKDEQCLLLVDGKYELSAEQPVALSCNSLGQEWVERWVNDEIPEDDLKPRNLIKLIESYIRKFYFTTDDNVYKVLALYTYLTYYYEALGEIPYLYFNGEKGSGKSILDAVMEIFCFNAHMGVAISEAALFRLTNIEGGTLILDEIENLTSRKAANDSLLAPILKGGYTRNAGVWRCDEDTRMPQRYDAFGPKIISNISGLEDVVLDRCIQISTYRLTVTNETRMEDPRYFAQEHKDEILAITSKCCISALVHFQELFRIFRGAVFEASSARLSQILTTILAVAKLADADEMLSEGVVGEYETALREYYDTNIVNIKQNIDETTPEGILKRIIPRIADELLGKIPKNECELTTPELHKYDGEIVVNKEDGWFEVTSVHLKCFLEEYMPGERVYVRYISKYVGTTFRMESKGRRRYIEVKNEDLLQEFNGNAHPKVQVFRFYFRDFVASDFLKGALSEEEHITKEETEIF